MLSLSPELLLDIFELAVYVPQPIDMIPSAKERQMIYANYYVEIVLIYSESRKTCSALCLVSRSFNALATPLLYSCICLVLPSTPRILTTLNKSKASMVRNLVLDISPHTLKGLERDFASAFAILSNVRMLIVSGHFQGSGSESEEETIISAFLARVMAASLGHTLRQFAIVGDAFWLFQPPMVHTFTSSLVHLTMLAGVTSAFPNPDNLQLVLPSQSSLTHLSLLVLPCPTIAPVEIAAPQLISIMFESLGGFFTNFDSVLQEIMHLLAHSALPALSVLVIGDNMPPWNGDAGMAPEAWRASLQAWVDAFAALPALKIMWILDHGLVNVLVQLARAGVIDLEEHDVLAATNRAPAPDSGPNDMFSYCPMDVAYLPKSFSTAHALALVSRFFNALATPLLYTCMIFDPKSTPRIKACLTLENASLVHHVVMDPYLPYASAHSEHELASIFAQLHAVQILTIWEFPLYFSPRPPFDTTVELRP
ncbi:hypothetical protein OF83DRAFT_1175652 [Amylostereum chailletii]|nr:hypothetical protein OF83DRAFT_1175652 [Amylostereum chailletii]